MTKYVRVMDGIKSNQGGFEYKIDEVNIANTWNPNASDSKEMGGFNFSSEDKILRWLHRGDTIYDVIIPKDAQVVLCDEEKGIYRTNRIIVTNPREITDEVVMDLCKKENLSDKIIAQCLVTMLWRKRPFASKYLIKKRVNMDNINAIITEFENYLSNGKGIVYDDLYDNEKEIYDILKEIQNDLDINLYIDKKPYVKTITNDKVINLTGESGSGKTYYSDKYLKDDNYIVIDTDIVFGNNNSDNKESLEIRKLFKDKPKDSFITDFDNCYKGILDYFKDSNKTVVIDTAQYRNIKDYSILKGKIIVIRTCIDACYERCLKRFDLKNPNATKEEKDKFAKRKLGMYKWFKGLNIFIHNVDKL